MYDSVKCSDVPKEPTEQVSNLLTEELCHLDELCGQATGILSKIKGPKPENCEKQAQPDSLLMNARMIREKTCELSRKLTEIDRAL